MKKLLLISLVFCSCTVTKDRNAVARVTYNPKLFEQVGRAWDISHPCAIDSVVSYINGDPIITYDTVYGEITTHDTVHNTDVQTKVVTVTKNIHDTVRVQVTDARALQLAKDDLNTAKGTISQLNDDNNAITAEKRKQTYWLIGISIFSVLAIGGLSYLLFK